MRKHTPGPWTQSGELSPGNSLIDIYGDGVWIGCVHGDHLTAGERPHEGFPGDNEGKANAQAIAALPDLLDAITSAHECLVQNCPAEDAQAILKAAISKVEEENPIRESE